jgi:hypothetical protein
MVVRIGQDPANIAKIICVEELFRVLLEPLPKSADTFRADVGIQIAEAVDEDAVGEINLVLRHNTIV